MEAAQNQPLSGSSAAKSPQDVVYEFWDGFVSRNPGKVMSIFPHAFHPMLAAPLEESRSEAARNATESYEAAAQECRARVAQIVKHCNRTNTKFTDLDFDINGSPDNCQAGVSYWLGDATYANSNSPPSLADLANALETVTSSRAFADVMSIDVNSLTHLVKNAHLQSSRRADPNRFKPGYGSIHRIDWIFDKPQFTIDGFSSSDVQQGALGDCWFLAGIATICSRKDLMERVCVASDPECGIYGFVFQRDGQWVSTVVDDYLFLKEKDFEDLAPELYDPTSAARQTWRRLRQTGSDALLYANCAHPNETWLPLLEKGYAKIHGDYNALEEGLVGEAIEDLTGGISTLILTDSVLKRQSLWEELTNPYGKFVFALSIFGLGSNQAGLGLNHAYSVLRATEETAENGDKIRLVMVRNPWGRRDISGTGEWNGPWSDGSPEWTPYWLRKLNYRFGDDGVFWMTFEDMLSRFQILHRTRLFDKDWTVIQKWASINISWVPVYHTTTFVVDIHRPGTVVFVVSQLDDRYFCGLEGEYRFSLAFVLYDVTSQPVEQICRVQPIQEAWTDRSISCEVYLPPGRYQVIPKITATKDHSSRKVEDVVKEMAEKYPEKLRQVGINYDISHAKVNSLGAPWTTEPSTVYTERCGPTAMGTGEPLIIRGRHSTEQPPATASDLRREIHVSNEDQRGAPMDNVVTATGMTEPNHDKQGFPTRQELVRGTGAEMPPEALSAMSQGGGVGDTPKEFHWPPPGEDTRQLPAHQQSGDSHDNAGDGLGAWNAVCVLGLRVYAMDPEMSMAILE